MSKQFINLGTSFALDASVGVEASVSCVSSTEITLDMKSSYGAFAGREFLGLGATLCYTLKDVKLISQSAQTCEGFTAIGTKSLNASAKKIFFGTHDAQIQAELGDLLFESSEKINVRMLGNAAATVTAQNGSVPADSEIITIDSQGKCIFSFVNHQPNDSLKLVSAGNGTSSVVSINAASVSITQGAVGVKLNNSSISLADNALEILNDKLMCWGSHELKKNDLKYHNGNVQAKPNSVQINSGNIV